MLQVEIRVKGQIGRDWSEWFGGLNIKHTEGGETVLSGQVRDQSALLGVLNKLSGLGLQLISVTPGITDHDNKREVMPIEEDTTVRPKKKRRHTMMQTNKIKKGGKNVT